MKIKQAFLSWIVFSWTILTWFIWFSAYTNLPTQNSWDLMTSTIWNNVINKVNTIWNDVDTLSWKVNLLNQNTQLWVWQTRQDVTASRVVWTTYTNNTGKPIVIVVRWAWNYVWLAWWNCIINWVSVPLAISWNTSWADNVSWSVIVPIWATYKVDLAWVWSRMWTWVELR